MRLKIAVPLIVLGVILTVLGIGQRTFWAPPEVLTATVPAGTETGPLTVIDAAVGEVADDVEVTVRGEGTFMLALGRADDVEAWVADASHLSIESVGDGQLRTAFTEGTAQVPNPSGSDLWVHEESADGQAQFRWEEPAPGDWSILLAADGTRPAPADVSVSWPNDQTTPFAVPLIIIGALLAIFGLALLFVDRFGGRNRPAPASGSGEAAAAGSAPAAAGPSAAGPSAAAPDAPAAGPKPADTKPGHGGPGGAAGFTALALASAVGLSAWGITDASAAGTPAPPEGDAEAYPVLLEQQLQRILDSVASTVQAADASGDGGSLAPRVDGAALALRTANYEVRTLDADAAVPAPVAAAPVLTRFITSTPAWPRTVVAVTQGEGNPVPQGLTLVQGSPRENYKLTGAVQMLPGASFPLPAPEEAGTTSFDPASAEGLKVSPQGAVAGVGAVLVNTADPFAQNLAPNTFVEQIAQFQRDEVAGNANATITFNHVPEAARTRALRTGDGGAIVFGHLRNTMTGVPAQTGATIALEEDYALQAGASTTTTGVDITFGESVMLYVPPAGSQDPVQVVGAAQHLLDVALK